MDRKVFNLSLPSEFLAIIDKQARYSFTNRSEYIKQVLIDRLKADGVLDKRGTFTPKSLDEIKKEQLQSFLDGYDPNLLTDDLD